MQSVTRDPKLCFRGHKPESLGTAAVMYGHTDFSARCIKKGCFFYFTSAYDLLMVTIQADFEKPLAQNEM